MGLLVRSTVVSLGALVGYTMGAWSGAAIGAVLVILSLPLFSFLARHVRRLALVLGAIALGYWALGGYAALVAGLLALFVPSIYGTMRDDYRCPHCGSTDVTVTDGTQQCAECGLTRR